ncbi:hypothetical protein GUITHDRAFT_118887 [Guillardia theta CCMP2712]|uniref:GPI transamidase subunit PIG-U n=1 Tax=Guillardia theta (strain CCMP2712) TaxID=905079 RepID=L1IFC2_GUITC|nr:hypothetical protein GUITHDRAFT_118887 [Guillardia theta CCMP2712]EKX34956.1 hypothetical protein GUITHDRAFT_118887 [Guillardia theta CCMP2712]|eukprot:XP_005821936.1 hypothetical protein GUITHDRAFT_118887 [Guillardia theta CCMP2712]
MIQVLVAVIMRMVVVEYERSPEVSKDCCHLGLALGDEDEEDDIPKLIEEENKVNTKSNSMQPGSTSSCRLRTCCTHTRVGACCAVMGALMYTSYAIMGSWDFVNAVYYFTFTVPDLSPNVGLFWYFFIEIFDQFRNFFLFLFQYHMLVYPIPLAMRVSHRPLFLFAFSLGYIAIFKSYPSIGDAAFYMPLLIIFHRQLIEMRNLFILVQILLFVTVLSPIFWHLWIVTGAGNSNFYYGLTLAYSAAQVLIISESMLAVLKQDKKQRLLSKKRD